ncbi:MAG: nitrate reductase [Blastocatellia bacterium]|nr:MAG: nitrate reductase [Blastocatellia bacterium]
MKRRKFLQLTIPAVAALGLPACTRIVGSVEPQSLSIVLRGGKVFYKRQWQTIDVGIDSNGRLRLGTNLRASDTINVNGKTISPGFVDVLADNSMDPDITYDTFEKYKVTDGVTTALQMHGGSAECGPYYQRFAKRSHLINYGVSTFVMVIRGQGGSVAIRKKLVEQNLAEGALGVSHSLEYQPTPYEEVLEYAKLAKKYERPFFLHLRYSSNEKELDGVDEAVQLAKDSGAHVHIDHLHSTGGTFHMESALDRIRAANEQGMTITTCVYPYSYWATYLYNRRFDPGWQQRYGISYGDLRLVGSSERLTPESFARYRKSSKLVATPEGIMPLEKTVDVALKESFCMIASDGGIQFESHANSHPRGAACFATALRHAIEINLPMELIIEKMTSLPASVVRPAMKDRGVIEDGAIADLTVFDPATVRGNATVENPNQFSSGIELVIVSGKVAYRDGKLRDKAGVEIKASS